MIFFYKFNCLFNYYYMNKPVTLLIVFTCGLYDLNLPLGKLILIWVQSSTLLIPRKPLTN